MSEKTPALISTHEAAKRLGILNDPDVKDPERVVRDMIRRGRFEGRQVGRVKRVVESSLTKFIQTGAGA